MNDKKTLDSVTRRRAACGELMQLSKDEIMLYLAEISDHDVDAIATTYWKQARSSTQRKGCTRIALLADDELRRRGLPVGENSVPTPLVFHRKDNPLTKGMDEYAKKITDTVVTRSSPKMFQEWHHQMDKCRSLDDYHAYSTQVMLHYKISGFSVAEVLADQASGGTDYFSFTEASLKYLLNLYNDLREHVIIDERFAPLKDYVANLVHAKGFSPGNGTQIERIGDNRIAIIVRGFHWGVFHLSDSVESVVSGTTLYGLVNSRRGVKDVPLVVKLFLLEKEKYVMSQSTSRRERR
jgi:hypothetical protein